MKKKDTIIPICFIIAMITLNACTYNKETTNTADNQTIKDSIITEEELWIVPDTITIPHDEFGEMVIVPHCPYCH